MKVLKRRATDDPQEYDRLTRAIDHLSNGQDKAKSHYQDMMRQGTLTRQMIEDLIDHLNKIYNFTLENE